MKAAAPVTIAKAIAISTRTFLMVASCQKKYLELYHTLAKDGDGNYIGNSTVAIE